MRSRTAENHDRTLELRRAIDRTGYYPEVVADGVDAAVAGEQVVSFYVHHEPTFERDEVRRHLSVVVLTPTRLVLFRRPIELRSDTRGDLSAMVLTVLVEQVSELIGRPPEEIDPRYDPDDD